MRFTIFLLCIIFSSNQLHAQKDSVSKIYAFKITGYIKTQGDSIAIVQVLKPASLPVAILDKQLAVLNHCSKNGAPPDTAMIGWGRCNLIKGEYYYFGIRLKKLQQASEGDLLYAKVKLPYVYDGLLLNVMNHAVGFTNVFGGNMVAANSVFTNTKVDEMRLLDSMVNDIRFTGSEMQKQMPEQNKAIKGGIYDGKKLFDAMQAVTRNELELFLKYMIARPENYAGNSWKISEIFATWMDGATPTVVEN